MKSTKPTLLIFICAVVISAALLFVRTMSHQFEVSTTTVDHPYIAFIIALMVAGLFWVFLIPLIRKQIKSANTTRILLFGIILGIGLRTIFLGSTPVYENDWNRYLWDGAVLADGINPYTYSPDDVLFTTSPQSDELKQLQNISIQNQDFAYAINYGHLTTIYPPIAQLVFGLGALIKPFDLDALRLLFLVIDALSMFLLIKTLDAFGRSRLWALLYALNPLLIYAGFNAVHMDIILVPFLLMTLLFIKTRPYIAASALAAAAAVKLWPLILAPVLFRQWRSKPRIYISSAILVASLFLLFMLPLLLALSAQSGVVAYAGSWARNAFFFPMLQSAIGLFVSDPGTLTRLLVAAILTILALWMGFRGPKNSSTLPQSMLILTAVLFILSPTGYPWYAIWLLVFLPFAPSYGVAMLTVTLPLYYARYALSEQALSDVYTTVLIPIQFIIPTAILLYETRKIRRTHAN